MSAGCHDHTPSEDEAIGPFRKVLWIVFALNASMFVVEMVAGALARSVSLQADALDFLGDSATYLISLFVLAKTLRWRAGAAFIKGGMMGLFGLWVLAYSVMEAISGTVPVAPVMGVVGFMAMAVNVFCAVLLFRHRGGDANRQSVWLCSRNDAIANVAVIIAAGLVFLLQNGWPDLLVGFFMAVLSLHSSYLILRQATDEWRTAGASGSGIESDGSSESLHVIEARE